MVTPCSPIPFPDESGPEPAGSERRAERRYLCTRTHLVRLIARPALQPHQAVLRNASTRSVGLLTLEPFPPATVLAIELPGRRSGSSGILTAKVRHTTVLADGTWLLGCSLSRPLAEEELLALL